MGTRAAALLALGSVALLACGDDERPATFEYIHPAIIVPNCATSGCHSDLAEVAEINLESFDEAYEELTGRPCHDDERDTRAYVNPGQPENSQLMFLLLGFEVPRAMPPDVQLPEAEVDLVERWILEGARCQ